MTKLSFMTPDRHFVGPNFEKCLTKFTDAAEMARCTGIPHSSINHILKGRPVVFEKTRRSYEENCRLYFEIFALEPGRAFTATDIANAVKPPTPHIETTPAQQALDLDPQVVFVVSVPSVKAAKLEKVLAMFGAEMVEVD
jgi:hypothetical protein